MSLEMQDNSRGDQTGFAGWVVNSSLKQVYIGCSLGTPRSRGRRIPILHPVYGPNQGLIPPRPFLPSFCPHQFAETLLGVLWNAPFSISLIMQCSGQKMVSK